ncbi:DUF2515 family protein [Aquibacillus sediminis]|uniref:DUF2515 family protein n=1 Tax=Aquibacillus sediminis TaxID=2574734 RepID=UPI001108812E|nr:DUF2515 family protein [Aquibacillus sediminis]
MNYVDYINRITTQLNYDNISRTKAYQTFYRLFPEIKWAFLASMVSRNAGWNMTDLQTRPFKTILSSRIRKQLFSTYERANWLIFSDAYPQLLIYQLSSQLKQPLFHLLMKLSISRFMVREWIHFWYNQDTDRLMTALIINEQNVIQSPVTKHPFFKRHVFRNWPYVIQDLFQLNTVLFPSRSGYAFGINVHDFGSTSKRITLGKKLAAVLFHDDYYPALYDFAIHTEHTGSRYDYEQYFYPRIKFTGNPTLRIVYPAISHQDKIRKDWYVMRGCKHKWWEPVSMDGSENDWQSFYRKRQAFKGMYHLKNFFS